MSYNKAILSAAGEHLDLAEWPGARHNPAVVKMFEDVGHDWVEDDETAWCASFVGSVLSSLGLPHTGKLNARSYEAYGQAVEVHRAQPGDIAVLWRGSPSSWMGHVAFFVRFEGDKVILRGGNQGNKVSDAAYDRSRIIAIRRADGVAPEGNRPVLRKGDKGAFVTVLQGLLVDLNYTLGKQDGHFGGRTLSAVIAFQSDNDLKADGIVGDRTWEALNKAAPRAERSINPEEVKAKSRTIAEVKKGKDVAVAGGGVATAGVLINQADEIAQVASQAEGVIAMLGGIAPSILIVMLVAGVAWFAYRHFTKIEDIRIDDARTGANDRI